MGTTQAVVIKGASNKNQVLEKLLLFDPKGKEIDLVQASYIATPPNIVFDGDSQFINGVVPTSITEYGDSLRALVSSGMDPRAILSNTSVAGRTMATQLTAAASAVDPLLHPVNRNVISAWAGTNDLFFGATAAAAYDSIVAYHKARREAGWKTIVYTILPRSNTGTPAAYEADRVTVNTNIRANWSTFADALCDIALDTRLQTSSDTRYFYDAVHCTLAGRIVVANLTKRALATLNIIVTTNPQLAGLVSPAIGKGSVGIGEGSLASLTTGVGNVALGRYALNVVTTGSSNTALGTSALQVATGGNNIAIGYYACLSNSSGTFNTAVGVNALFLNNTGSLNTAVGINAGFSSTGGGIVAIGGHAAYSPAGVAANATTTGLRQTLVGTETGQSSATQQNDCTAVGYRALFGAMDATAIGSGAQALHLSSVALGKGSVTTAANQVMVGARDVEITDTTKGVIQKSPDGTRYRIAVANGGALTAVAVV